MRQVLSLIIKYQFSPTSLRKFEIDMIKWIKCERFFTDMVSISFLLLPEILSLINKLVKHVSIISHTSFIYKSLQSMKWNLRIYIFIKIQINEQIIKNFGNFFVLSFNKYHTCVSLSIKLN